MNELLTTNHVHLHHQPLLSDDEDMEQRYRTLFASHPDAVLVIDLEGNIVDANPTWEQLTGYSRAEWSRLTHQHLVFSEELENVNDLFKRVVDGETITCETMIYHRTGELLPVQVKSFPYMIDGKIIGLFAVASCLPRQTGEEAEWLAKKAQYHLITEHSSDWIYKLSLEGKCLYVSPACRTLLGYEPEELVGQSVWELLHPDEQYRITEQELPTAFLVKENKPVTCRFRTKKGDYIWLETVGKPVPDPVTGKDQEIIALARDITDRMRTQELLRHSEKLTLVGQLAAGIAHEIRNPLTALKGFLQLMQSNSQQKQEYFSIMSSELTRIELIVSELLVLAKPQTSVFQERNLHTLIKHVVTLIDTAAIIKNVQICVEVDENVPPIRCDENQLKQAFLNFLKNGIEAMHHGGTITIKVWREMDRVVLRFIDSGAGIPEDIIRRLGEPFFTTKDSGTGLGLMVSQNIIENHQGWIRLSSELNHGTTVEVSLPIECTKN